MDQGNSIMIETTQKQEVDKLKNLTGEELVSKSNTLIQASYELSLNEQRIICLLAAKIHPKDKEFRKYRLHKNDYISFLKTFGGINSNNNAFYDLKTTVLRLQNRKFAIHEEDRIIHLSWLSSVSEPKRKDNKDDHYSYVDLRFDPSLKPYLLELKSNFTTYRLKYVVGLKSAKHIKLYELLKQYLRLRSRVFKLEDLRNELGIKSRQYKRYNDFKKAVLDPSKTSINKKTDIRIDYREIKNGRRIEKIEFIIFPKSEVSIESKSNQDQSKLSLEERVYLFIIKECVRELNKTVEEFEQEFLFDKIIGGKHKLKSIAFHAFYVVWANQSENPKLRVDNQLYAFQAAMKISRNKWNVPSVYNKYFKSFYDQVYEAIIDDEEKGKKRSAEEQYQSLSIDERYQVIYKSVLEHNDNYNRLRSDFRQSLDDFILAEILPKSEDIESASKETTEAIVTHFEEQKRVEEEEQNHSESDETNDSNLAKINIKKIMAGLK